MSPVEALDTQEWRARMRADWEARLAETQELVDRGLLPLDSVDVLRVQMESELEGDDSAAADYYRNGGPTPTREPPVEALQQRYVGWLDTQIVHGKISRKAPVWRWRLSLLPRRAGDLAGTLLACAAQRAPRAREHRARSRASRSPPSSDDDLADLDPTRRAL
jgi:hypothetical protein